MIVKQAEAIPESYPDVDGVTGDALAIAWQRVEHFIAWRYSPREVVWRVEADGCEWQAPLAPVVSLTVQNGDETPYEPESGPLGGWMLPCGIVTVTATVGAGPAPAAVLEAVKRYAGFIASVAQLPAGITRIGSGALSLSYRADQVNSAMALVNSGAADLLRAYRRA